MPTNAPSGPPTQYLAANVRTNEPTNAPTGAPTLSPSFNSQIGSPTNAPSGPPTQHPVDYVPMDVPTTMPTVSPSLNNQIGSPTIAPTDPPIQYPVGYVRTNEPTIITNAQEADPYLLDYVNPDDIIGENVQNDFGNYVVNMGIFGTSGDHITLMAAANHYNVTVVVHHTHNNQNNDVFNPLDGQSRGELHLAFNGGHYMQINHQGQITERGDQGNCQFAVIAAKLNRLGLMPEGIQYNEDGSMVSQNTHMAIRHSIIDHIINNQDNYVDFIALGE